MIFQTRWTKATYIVRATAVELYPGIGRKVTPGLRAEFTGRNRLFDSERTAQKHGWTEEERDQVERHLLTHKDFGRGIYLAPGETVPDRHADLAPKQKPAGVKRCLQVWVENGDIVQCQEETMLQSDYCQEHNKDRIAIKPGLMTTKDSV